MVMVVVITMMIIMMMLVMMISDDQMMMIQHCQSSQLTNQSKLEWRAHRQLKYKVQKSVDMNVAVLKKLFSNDMHNLYTNFEL